MQTKPSVFVVDEDPLGRSTVRQVANALNVPCKEYASGLEFIEDFDPSKPGCVLLENRIPGLSGLEVQQHLAAHAPTLPVVFVTGKITVSTAVRAMRAGAIHVLEKPLREAELWDTLQEALRLNQLRRSADRQRQHAQGLIAALTAKEIQVMRGISSGLSNAAMATRLRVSQRTIELRRSKVMKKLRVNSLAELVRLVMLAEDGNGDGPLRHESRRASIVGLERRAHESAIDYGVRGGGWWQLPDLVPESETISP